MILLFNHLLLICPRLKLYFKNLLNLDGIVGFQSIRVPASVHSYFITLLSYFVKWCFYLLFLIPL